MAVSSRARSKIRAHFNREHREDAFERGREAVQRALRRKGIGYARAMASGELTEVARRMNYRGTDALFLAVGEGHVAAATVAQALVDLARRRGRPHDAAPAAAAEPDPHRAVRPGGDAAIEVEGDSGMLVKLARCCTPVPGDTIEGFVTRGRGVSVHRSDCPNISDLHREPERFVPVDWAADSSSTFRVAVEVEAFDRKHLLRDVTTVLGDLHLSIVSAQVSIRPDHVAVLRFSFELADPTHLTHALRSIETVEGVYDVYRVVPRGNGAGGGRDGADEAVAADVGAGS
jgi:GTP diphosphokinase / guanosine-3',5'-bis(diphosphate) 3'-diphosphatase